MTRHTTMLLAGAGLWLAATHAIAAESYDNCTGFIDSLPATIATQGVWCLRQHLSTAIASGNAITIATNNVTIDCNDFKVGGLAAGDTSQAIGIQSLERQNATVRQCALRGFRTGIQLFEGSGHLVEDNLLDQNLRTGIAVLSADGSRVQRNRVNNTGGAPGVPQVEGIVVSGDAIDNTVDGVFSDAASPSIAGIRMTGASSEARGNQVRNLLGTGGFATGIQVTAPQATLRENMLAAPATTNGTGINVSAEPAFCIGNIATGFSTGFLNCRDVGGNDSL